MTTAPANRSRGGTPFSSSSTRTESPGQRLVLRRGPVPLVSCDLAIAAEEAVFGISEVNWGVTPGNLVTRALAETIPTRDAMYYIMTGERFDGRRASGMRLVNEAVPAAQLRDRTLALARRLTTLSQWVVRGAKLGFRNARLMPWDAAEDFRYASTTRRSSSTATRGSRA